jgi:predicted RNA methylase
MASQRSLLQTPFDLFAITARLNDTQRQVALMIYREGRVTVEQVQKAVGISEEDTLRVLADLVRDKLVFRYEFHNFVFFELNMRTRRFIAHDRFPSGPVVPLVYHFSMLCSEARLDAFSQAVQRVVKPGDVVFDLGCGTAVLSILAARQGAYVFAVEVDPLVADAAEYFVKSLGYSERVRIIQDDVRNLDFENEADVVICEMLDTGLIAELQVPVMNQALRKIMKPGARTIPSSVTNYVQLVRVDYVFAGMHLPLIHFEAHGSRPAETVFTDRHPYGSVFFDRENSLSLDEKIELAILQTGTANSLRLTTDTVLAGGIVQGGIPWFNPPIVLPLGEARVRAGTAVHAHLAYDFGGGTSSVRYSLEGAANER